MNLTNFAAEQTMTSREIAELTEKEHGHVLRDIDTMFEQLGIPPEGYIQNWTHPQNKIEYRGYALPQDLTITLVSGYNAMLRLRIVRRWAELERAAPPARILSAAEQALLQAQALVDIERKQNEQAQVIAQIETRIENLADTQLLLSRPSASESIGHIRIRINKKYGLPIRIIDEIVRQSPYAPKPAGMVKNSHEEAQGGSYAVYWTKDINAVFSRFVAECRHETATQAVHPLIEGRFKLNGGAQ